IETSIKEIAVTDMESIDVIKEASRTGIYGTRGANWVVIVTTKSPKAGKTSISYNNYFQSKYMPKELGVLSPYEFTLLQYEYGDNTDRKSTRLNSSHVKISYAVFCLKKKKKDRMLITLTTVA